VQIQDHCHSVDCRALALDITLCCTLQSLQLQILSVCLFVRSIYSSTDTRIGMLARNDQPTEFDGRKAPSSSVVFCNGCIVAKRCKIGPRLLLITNRKSNIGFQMTLTLMDDFERTMVCQL